MIQLRNIHLQFGDQVVFDHIDCLVNKQDKIGLVGRNGTGKSTLLKIIAKHQAADDGVIDIQKGARIAYMPQDIVITSTKPVLEETLSALPGLYALLQEKEILEKEISDNPTTDNMNRYAEVEHELQLAGLAQKTTDAKKILTGLGFTEQKQQFAVNELSVGWRMRIVLAKLLLQDADIYLFDEPTNHLDISAKNWFLQFLKQSSFGYVLVCHDRYFLDLSCNTTYELSQGNLHIFYGNYSYYKEQKILLTQQREQAYKKQQQDIKHKQQLIERFRAKASKAKMAQSLMKKVEKIERIEVEDSIKSINLKLKKPQQSGNIVLKVNEVAHAFDQELFKDVSFHIERGDKIAIIAPNGTGKTTLFNLIAKKLHLQKGTIELGHNVISALFDQDQEKVLDPNKTILQEVSHYCPVPDQQIRTVLGALLFSQDDTDKKTSVLSGGERNRVAMSKIILSDANLLLLDEPTNHLDIESKEIILQALQQYEGTILFVSHDQDFVNKLANKIVELDEQNTQLFLGNYDSYLQTKAAQEALYSPQNKPKAIIKKNSDNKLIFDLKKQCKKLESKINQLEHEKEKTLTTLGTVAYGTEKYLAAEKKYKELDNNIIIHTEEWEKILLKIDKECT